MKDRYDSLSSFIKDVIGENLRIALLVDYLLKGHGAAHVVRMHAKELISNGYDVTVFALESDMKLPKNVEIVIIGCPSNAYLKAINQIIFPIIFKNIKFIHKLKDFDLIISYQHTLAWLALFAKKKYNIPIVYYNLPVVSDKELFPSLPYWMFMKCNEIIFNYLARKSDYVISISEYAKKVLYENAGISSIVIYLAIDPIFYQKVDGKLIREKYKLGNSPIILFVGRLVPSKGIHLLIEAFSYVKKEIPDAKLIIVGRRMFDDYYQKLEKLIAPFKDSVIFTGYVPDEELPYYYAACDVYATASLHEGFNLPAVEAQAYGKPVVAFDIGSHREVIRNGFLVEKGNIKDFANKIIEILEKKRGDRVRNF